MKNSKKIIRYRLKYPYKRVTEIAEMVGVNANWVYHVLQRHGIPPSSGLQKKKAYYCKYCEQPTEGKRNTHDECYIKAHYLQVQCSYCRIVFYRKKSYITRAYQLRPEGSIYCSQACYRKGKSEKATKYRKDELLNDDRLRGFVENLGAENP